MARTPAQRLRNRYQHPRRNRRLVRGAVIYYMAGVLFLVAAFCSLGVDLGRVQVVKAELRRAADSAARAAVAAVPTDIPAAQTLAAQYASANLADGSPVALLVAQDVEVGRWRHSTRTFTPLAGNYQPTANAVRITARRTTARGTATPLLFARVLGARACDASASAIANRVDRQDLDIVGLDFVTLNGNNRIDSYDSTVAPYSAATARADVSVASNGVIDVGGSSQIRGDTYYGTDPAPSSNVSGRIEPLSDDLAFTPSSLPASYTSHGSVSLTGNQTYTLSAGNHYFTDLTIRGNSNLNVTGPVNVYIQNAFTMNGNGQVAVAGNSPPNLRIHVLGTQPVTLGHNNLFASIYAPRSPMVMNGNADLFGSVIAASIRMNGNNTIHYDQALATPSLPPKIVLVK